MNPRRRLFWVPGVLALVTACAFTGTPVALKPVGPSPIAQAGSTSTGWLKVYTAMKTYPVDDETWYRAHTDYGVYAPDGARVISVRNAATYHDAQPALVSLPPGKYTVEGWADRFELVQVPIEISAGHLTLVNLEAGHNRRFAGAKPDELVRTPDGRIIGWSPSLMAAR